jgi:hypothetical protein
MTSYVKQAMLGPVMSPMVSKDKGDVSNRINCAGSQLANYTKTLAEDAVVIGGVAVGAKAIKKGGKFAMAMEKVTNAITKACEKTFGNKFILHGKNGNVKIRTNPSWIRKLKAMPASKKGIGLLVGLGALAVSYIGSKHLYRMGQIDQKYSDKATLRNQVENKLE